LAQGLLGLDWVWYRDLSSLFQALEQALEVVVESFKHIFEKDGS
jgi:hypothetical protein